MYQSAGPTGSNKIRSPFDSSAPAADLKQKLLESNYKNSRGQKHAEAASYHNRMAKMATGPASISGSALGSITDANASDR